MSLARYAAYKDSRVEWLGEVPAHWEASVFRHIISSIESGTSVNAVDEPAGDGQVGVLKTSCVYTGHFRAEENKAVVDDELDRVSCPLRAGTLIVSRMNTPELVGATGHVEHAPDGIYLPDRLWQVTLKDAEASFVHYWTQSDIYRASVKVACSGTSSSMQNLGQDQFKAFSICIPSSAEQTAIAAFLDRETGKIDALVAEQQKLIALLKEKRQALISHAVTRGLDPTAPTKDSGIEWLGLVPAHWTVMPIRLAAKLESGHTPSRSHPEYWENCDVPWFTLADVWQIREGGVEYVEETKEKVSELGLSNSSARLLPKGTVVLSRTASVGFSAIMKLDMATTQDFANWICGSKLRPEYLLYTFRSMGGEFKRLMMGSTHNTIYMPDIQSFRFVLPSLDEQEAIVKHIRTTAGDFDQLMAEADHAITLLKERRAALISAAVTGKIDVRGLVPVAA